MHSRWYKNVDKIQDHGGGGPFSPTGPGTFLHFDKRPPTGMQPPGLQPPPMQMPPPPGMQNGQFLHYGPQGESARDPSAGPSAGNFFKGGQPTPGQDWLNGQVKPAHRQGF
jgi:hypothetical protein